MQTRMMNILFLCVPVLASPPASPSPHIRSLVKPYDVIPPCTPSAGVTCNGFDAASLVHVNLYAHFNVAGYSAPNGWSLPYEYYACLVVCATATLLIPHTTLAYIPQRTLCQSHFAVVLCPWIYVGWCVNFKLLHSARWYW